ncbi:MAG: MFS transporter [Eubacterium sp.]|nr:MFS transporter [Eubacterium sp.]
MKKNKTLSVSSALIYALGIFGVQIFVGYVNSFQTEFYNKMYSSFDGSIFYASAIIIFAAKLISCVFDPLIGAVIDKSSLKGGKMRPWVLRSALPLAVLTTLIFIYIPFDKFGSKILLYIYITATTVLWNIAMSFADIPSQGMLSLLSPDADERNVAASFSNIAKTMALALPGVFVTAVMMLLGMIKGEGNYEDKEYYLITALVFFVLGTALIILMYKKNTEAVESAKSARTVSIKEMFSEMKSNKMIFIVFLINMIGFARSMGLIVCVQANGALIGKINLFGMVMDTTADATWLPGILGGVSGFIGICVVPLINKKFGEKKTYIGFSIATFVFNIAVCIFYWLLPQGSTLRYGNAAFYMIVLFQFAIGFLTAANTYIPLVMTADIVEYRLYKTGERKEGVNYAILSLSIKLSNAICVAVGLLFVAASGYTQVVYETGVIPAKMQNIIMFAYIGFVGVSALISAVPVLFYKINDETKAKMRMVR